jgi:trans-aconitate 2-methyltransferase
MPNTAMVKDSLMSRWNPDAYLKFEQERTQPSRDLVARIGLSNPKAIVDIGCGPGNSTHVLRDAWPKAKVIGLDASKEMIDEAQATYPECEWILADAAVWQPLEKYDLVFSNATLQWIPNHAMLLQHLFGMIENDGAIAVQVPFNIESPILQAIASVAESAAWRDLMHGCSDQIFYRDETHYYEIISKLSSRVDMWTTTYIHVMESHQSLIDWYSSTGLKIYLERIGDEEGKLKFKTAILEACKAKYQVQSNGKILFPFKRIFFVAYKDGSET